jgi:hypothetical protein
MIAMMAHWWWWNICDGDCCDANCGDSYSNFTLVSKARDILETYKLSSTGTTKDSICCVVLDASRPCYEHELKCKGKNSHCVNRLTRVCDFVNDCDEKTDEANCGTCFH